MNLKGIYEIKNNVNGMVYIGSSKNINLRWYNHIQTLLNNTHHSYLLQKDWNKYNYSDFSFRILELVNNEKDLKDVEQTYIDMVSTEKLYNTMLYTKYSNSEVSKSFKYTLTFIDNLPDEVTYNLKKNIEVFDRKNKLKRLGLNEYDLSKTWFIKNKNEYDPYTKGKANFFKNYNKLNSDIRWTTFTNYYNYLKYKGDFKKFTALNDTCIDKANTLCFIANIYPNRFVSRQLDDNVNDDQYALSILLQWIINVSDISKPIQIFVMSMRMENILRNWLKN